MRAAFRYLGAIIDLYSRFVVGWSISNTMDAEWVANCFKEAFEKHGVPEIINSDQGNQFTSDVYVNLLKGKQIQISMDGKGRAVDNIFIERLRRSVKWDGPPLRYVYLNPEVDETSLHKGLQNWFRFYNSERKHQGIGQEIPMEPYKLAA